MFPVLRLRSLREFRSPAQAGTDPTWSDHGIPSVPDGMGRQELASYLIVKVQKNRVEVQVFTQHSVNVVLAKTTRNNPIIKLDLQAA